MKNFVKMLAFAVLLSCDARAQIISGGGSGGSGTSIPSVYCASASASSTTYTCTPSPAVGSYAAGLVAVWVPDVSCAAGAKTLNISGLGAKAIKLADGTTNVPAGLCAAGSAQVPLVYDGTSFRYSDGYDPGNSGASYFQGLTSGGVALSAADVAGTAIVYVLPSTNGASGQVLSDSGTTTCPTLPASFPATCHQLVWIAAGGAASIKFSFDGGGVPLTAPATRCGLAGTTGTIAGWGIIGDQSGSATVNVSAVAVGSYTGPGSASSITGGNDITVSSAAHATGLPTSWTTSVTPTQVLCFTLSATSTFTWINVILTF